MRRIGPRGGTGRGISPAMVVALLALFAALGGTSYAALKLPKNSVGSKQIKAKAVTLTKIAPAARSALKGATGSRGASGPKGDKGDAGLPGANGSAGAIAYGGHIDALNDVANTDAWAAPVGESAVSPSTPNFRTILAPDVPTTLKHFAVKISNPPGGTSLRFFYLYVNGQTIGTCTVLSASQSCGVAPNAPIPALATIAIQSSVAVSDAVGAFASFSWQAG